MIKLVIYHNPRCTKSRQTLQLLIDQGFEPNVVEYLKEPLGKTALKKIVKQLGLDATELIRKSDLKKMGFDAPASNAAAIDLIVEYPVLMERPIVTNGISARIGRPPENVLDLV